MGDFILLTLDSVRCLEALEHSGIEDRIHPISGLFGEYKFSIVVVNLLPLASTILRFVTFSELISNDFTFTIKVYPFLE